MQAKKFSLTHLARQPQGQKERAPLLLLLHGYGSNEHDLFGLTPYLDERTLIVSARAPLLLGPGSYAWFEITFVPQGITVDRQQVIDSAQLVTRFIDEVISAYSVDPSRIYLIGFSQGASLSAFVALTRPDLVAGAALLSGYISDDLRTLSAPPQQLAGKPFLVHHGTFDEVLPIGNGRASRDFLRTLPVDLRYREYPMGHTISQDSLSDLVVWLQEQLDTQG